MQRNAKSAVVLLLVVLAASSGCSRQKSLARRLSEADRVVATLSNMSGLITISNEQVKAIVQALGTAQRIPGEGLCASVGYTLDFFKGTNQLATVPTAYGIFLIGRTPYQDKSGTLAALYENSSL